MSQAATAKKRKFTFAQGMQVFLVRKILTERYTMGLLIETKTGNDFFHHWSKIVREKKGPPTVENPEQEAERLSRTSSSSAETSAPASKVVKRGFGATYAPRRDPVSVSASYLGVPYAPRGATVSASASYTSRSVTNHPYFELLTESRFSPLRPVLADKVLGELMRIEYAADTRALAATSKDELPAGLLR